MNPTLLPERIFQQILNEPFICISVSSCFPNDIINKIENYKNQNLSLVLFNGDVWRYGNDPTLLEYLGNQPKKFYIATLGYKNQKILDNVYELSLPLWYFESPKDNIAMNLRDRSYGFSCLNNSTSFHRLVLGCELWKNNLLEGMVFTQNLFDLPHGYHRLLMENIHGMTNYLSLLPISWPGEKRRDFREVGLKVDHVGFTDTYCNIAAESEVQDFVFEGPTIDLPVLTEKSYKPLRSKQIPIWLASPGHCKYIKSLGFETMEDFLPVGYDDMGLFDKVESIVQTVAKGREYAKEFYHAHLPEIEHNYQLIQSDRVGTIIIDNIKNFLAAQ